ncbi:uncharacterized protein LOC131619888 [Vicia villosa]|uniref:uncharacterized protein LOC131619888 n=1 Tax=Vicia villosa TaxID=3911 RepID=UPI00273C6812|nr:uncharacterized protein LOC131619888 [Vicia villosa]
MSDRQDCLRLGRVTQYASLRRERSQTTRSPRTEASQAPSIFRQVVSEAPSTSGPSTSSSRSRRESPVHPSPPPSSRRRTSIPSSPPQVYEFGSTPPTPPVDQVPDVPVPREVPVPGEAPTEEAAPASAAPEVPQDQEPLKVINHGRKISKLTPLAEPWFDDIVRSELMAKDWYLDKPETVMTDWNTLEEKFLERFYSQNRFFEAKTAIAVFSQGSNESLMKHGKEKKAGILELNNSDALLAQNKLLTSQVELLTQQISKLPQQLKELNGVSNSYQVAKCELCKGEHQTGFCPPVLEEEVNYMNNNQGQRQNQYQNPLYQQANTQENPKEHCKAVVTRTEQKRSNNEVEKNDVEDETGEEAEKHDGEDEEYEIIDTNAEEEKVNKEVKKKEKLKRKSSREKMASNVIPSQHLPYPHAPSKKDNARQYASAIISRLPQKARDPGRVTLLITIGNQNIGNGSIDLGSSINLIPLSIVKRLGNIEMKSTRMTLQLADKSTTLPYGVAQDMLVK